MASFQGEFSSSSANDLRGAADPLPLSSGCVPVSRPNRSIRLLVHNRTDLVGQGTARRRARSRIRWRFVRPRL
jgi:hypothetical protein